MVVSHSLRSRNVYRKVSSSENLLRLLGGKSERSEVKSKGKSHNSQSPKKSEKTQSERSRKSEKSRKSRKSEKSKSKKSQKSKKELNKGLSPPKDVSRHSRHSKIQDTDDNNVPGTFDKTQWERTRWSPDSREPRTKGTCRQRRSTAPPSMGSGSSQQPHQVSGSLVPGEARQEEGIRGEHLRKKPMITLVLLSIEAFFGVISLCVWSFASDNPMLPLILVIVNLLVVFGVICSVFLIELCRFQVKSVEEGTKNRLRRLKIPYRWRFILTSCHMLRLIFICCNITLMALDNDFDGGSIAVLAMQPIHLLIVGAHLVMALRPKAKQ